MKKAYNTPKATKVDYSFQEQLVAQSWPTSDYADPWRGSVCTYNDGSCNIMFTTSKARGLYDCEVPLGNPDLINPYADCY